MASQKPTILVKLDDSQLAAQLKKIQNAGKGIDITGITKVGKTAAKTQESFKDKMIRKSLEQADRGTNKSPITSVLQETLKSFEENIEKLNEQFKEFMFSLKFFNDSVSKFNKAVQDLSKLFKGMSIDEEGIVPPEEQKEEEKEEESPKGSMARIMKALAPFGDKLEVINEGFEKVMNTNPKFLGIAMGVGVLVGLITTSSQIFQNTFKLLSTSVMLIFRPIGDFIGMLLRPFIVRFLHLLLPVMIPAMEWARTTGMDLGNNFLKWLDNSTWQEKIVEFVPLLKFLSIIAGILGFNEDKKDPTAGMTKPDYIEMNKEKDWYDHLEDAWNSTAKFFGDAWAATEEALRAAWDVIVGFFTWVGESVGGALTAAWEGLVQWASWISSSVMSGLTEAWSKIVEWALMVRDHFIEGLRGAWEAINNWAQWISSSIMPVLMAAWGAIVSWALDTKDRIVGLLHAAWNAIISVSEMIGAGLKAAYDGLMGFVHTITGGLFGEKVEEKKEVEPQATATPEVELDIEPAIESIQESGEQIASTMQTVETDTVVKVANSWATIGSTVTQVSNQVQNKDKKTWKKISDTTVEFADMLARAYASAKAMLARALRAQRRAKRGMASGGLITEPIEGVGLNTGTFYQFGESGPELVVPNNKLGAYGNTVSFNPTINVSVSTGQGVNADMIAKKIKDVLKKEVYEELMEQTQNVGVV